VIIPIAKTTHTTMPRRPKASRGTAPRRAIGDSADRNVGSGIECSIGITSSTGTSASAKSQRKESARG